MHAFATKDLSTWNVSRRIDGKGAFQTNVTWDDTDGGPKNAFVSSRFCCSPSACFVAHFARVCFVIICCSLSCSSVARFRSCCWRFIVAQSRSCFCGQVAGRSSTAGSARSYGWTALAIRLCFTRGSSTAKTTRRSSTLSALCNRSEAGSSTDRNANVTGTCFCTTSEYTTRPSLVLVRHPTTMRLKKFGKAQTNRPNVCLYSGVGGRFVQALLLHWFWVTSMQ